MDALAALAAVVILNQPGVVQTLQQPGVTTTVQVLRTGHAVSQITSHGLHEEFHTVLNTELRILRGHTYENPTWRRVR
jgi:hypothetical protein